MIKHLVAVLLMSFSAFLMVGHDIIPHHHEDSKDHHHEAHHHVTDHHSHAHSNDSHASQHRSDSNETPDEKGGVGDLLSYFVHLGDVDFQESSLKQTIDVENDRIDPSVVEFGQDPYLCPGVSKSIGYTYKGPDYIPPISTSKGLRAPPVFFS